ncbi:DUF1294 domain-containing protein [Microbulbifer halophilus]|uniref:DUF1294 domain-containing protein n=1 Tax=Microbulbifer halophilus TaxID=453963 RepID=A0ABW5EH69_9GAMM|nr:DUF1294 domain-containing protein [Microbulbifer halophilus]MCW8128415.1 DUF1294 domain-containing protein [Microbulbifer halophilus]
MIKGRRFRFAIILPVALVATLWLAVRYWFYPLEVIYWIAGISALTALFYGWDKLCAVRDWRRISERTLHLLSLAGGWPGAILAQQAFNHKTSKVTFRRLFWCTVVLNGALLGATFSDSGGALLREGIQRVYGLVNPAIDRLPGS